MSLSSTLKIVGRTAGKYLSRKEFRARFTYAGLLQKEPAIRNNQALFQSFDGKSFGGNPFYILQSMASDPSLARIKPIVAVSKNAVDATRQLLQTHGIGNCEVVALHSRRYCEALCTSKYLVNNSTFPTYFVKRQGQLYLNTWHGTPLKHMGRLIADQPQALGNTQRNLLMADWLLYPNAYSRDIFVRDYMLGPFYQGNYLVGGYPCNSVLCDSQLRVRIREHLGIEPSQKVVAFMPTWRQGKPGGHKRKHLKMLEYTLMHLDEYLDDGMVVLAKPHYYDSASAIDFSMFKRVREFPADLETYEALACADALLTDYSSVMFDFLNTGRPIVLYTYDRSEYFETRGTYLNIEELPFFASANLPEVTNQLNRLLQDDAQPPDYAETRAFFCPCDSPDAAQQARDLLFKSNETPYEVTRGSSLHNGKPNVLIFGGVLKQNGITTSLTSLLNGIDTSKANFILTVYASKSRTSFAKQTLASLKEGVLYMPAQGSQLMTVPQAIARFAYFRLGLNSPKITKNLRGAYSMEAMRLYPSIRFHAVVHFTGYERGFVHLMREVDAKKHIMYVHSDMVRERDLKGNYHVPSITLAYREFEKLAVVREGLDSIISQGFCVPMGRIAVVHNPIDVSGIRAKAALLLEFAEATLSNWSIKDIQELLEDDSIVKFVNVARFSPEKGLGRLIDAYSSFANERPNSALIIIGGRAQDYEPMLEKAQSSAGRIVLIQDLPNPFPIVTRCDAFFLSSYYEGLPMSIMEALVLGVPVISVSIPGPREFLEQGYGFLVDDSTEGLLDGMRRFADGKISNLAPFDAEAFNENALREFYDLIELNT